MMSRRRRVGFVRDHVSIFSFTAIVPLLEASTIVFTPGLLRRIAKQARAVDVQLVHLARVVLFARRLCPPDDKSPSRLRPRAPHPRRWSLSLRRRVDAQTGQPFRESRWPSRRMSLVPDSTSCRTRCEPRKPVPPVIKVVGRDFLDDSRVLLRALLGHDLRGASFGGLSLA